MFLGAGALGNSTCWADPERAPPARQAASVLSPACRQDIQSLQWPSGPRVAAQRHHPVQQRYPFRWRRRGLASAPRAPPHQSEYRRSPWPSPQAPAP